MGSGTSACTALYLHKCVARFVSDLFLLTASHVNKATGSKAKAKTPSLKAKDCRLNPRTGQSQCHSWTRPLFQRKAYFAVITVSDVRILVVRTKILNTVKYSILILFIHARLEQERETCTCNVKPPMAKA